MLQKMSGLKIVCVVHSTHLILSLMSFLQAKAKALNRQLDSSSKQKKCKGLHGSKVVDRCKITQKPASRDKGKGKVVVVAKKVKDTSESEIKEEESSSSDEIEDLTSPSEDNIEDNAISMQEDPTGYSSRLIPSIACHSAGINQHISKAPKSLKKVHILSSFTSLYTSKLTLYHKLATLLSLDKLSSPPPAVATTATTTGNVPSVIAFTPTQPNTPPYIPTQLATSLTNAGVLFHLIYVIFLTYF